MEKGFQWILIQKETRTVVSLNTRSCEEVTDIPDLVSTTGRD